MKIQLIRHATSLITISGKKILLDPMLSPAHLLDPVANSANEIRNPLVDLPVDKNDLLNIDGIIVTHTHRDHFDDAAAQFLNKHIPIFCQPEDNEKLVKLGFLNVYPVEESLIWEKISFTRTKGQHGTGAIGQKMSPVSGFVIQCDNEPCLYIAGDTIWCTEVQDALDKYKPEVAVVFAGAAQFLQGGPITMTSDDIYKFHMHSPKTKIIVTHMEAWNHCLLTRRELREFIRINNMDRQVCVPENGESIDL